MTRGLVDRVLTSLHLSKSELAVAGKALAPALQYSLHQRRLRRATRHRARPVHATRRGQLKRALVALSIRLPPTKTTCGGVQRRSTPRPLHIRVRHRLSQFAIDRPPALWLQKAILLCPPAPGASPHAIRPIRDRRWLPSFRRPLRSRFIHNVDNVRRQLKRSLVNGRCVITEVGKSLLAQRRGHIQIVVGRIDKTHIGAEIRWHRGGVNPDRLKLVAQQAMRQRERLWI